MGKQLAVLSLDDLIRLIRIMLLESRKGEDDAGDNPV